MFGEIPASSLRLTEPSRWATGTNLGWWHCILADCNRAFPAQREFPHDHLVSDATRLASGWHVQRPPHARQAIEAFTLNASGGTSAHERYELADLLDLRKPEEEVDIEGLSAEAVWLWIVGSHAQAQQAGRDPGRAD